ncbi:MAG: DUF1801 domain-containing protein [Bacteroidota bacterium]
MKSAAVTEYLRYQSPFIGSLMSSIRDIIWKSIPDVEETIKYTVPFYTRKGLLCYLSPLKKKDGIYIGFANGRLMSDDYGIFTGKDLKQIRHIEFRKKSDIQKRILKQYLQEAMIINEMKRDTHPFSKL